MRTSPTDETGQEPRIDRRTRLTGAASLVGATVAGLIPPALPSSAKGESPDLTCVPGRGLSPFGVRALGETVQRLSTATHSLTPHQALHGIITPSALHFERHHNGVLSINPDRHRLLIHGLVDRPLTFLMNDLTRFPSVTRTLFIECSGNSGKEWKGPTGTTVQETHGLMSTSEWTGVPLATVLAETGGMIPIMMTSVVAIVVEPMCLILSVQTRRALISTCFGDWLLFPAHRSYPAGNTRGRIL